MSPAGDVRRLFIVNPMSAGVAKRGSSIAKIAPEFEADIHQLGDFSELPHRIALAAKAGMDHVVIEGGDGTVQGVLSAFLRQAEAFTDFPKFTLVPGGMTNQVAKNIGLKSYKLNRVRAALARPKSTITLPMLDVSEPDGAVHSGFLFSTGAIPQITTYTTQNLHRRGIGGSLAVLGGILKGLRGTDSEVMYTTPLKLNAGALFDGSHLGTVITTLPGLILGLDPFYGDGHGPLRATWIAGNYTRLPLHVLSIWLGRKAVDRTRDGIHSQRFETLDYDYHGPVVLDGEFLSFPSGKFTVRAGQPVTFLR